MLEQEEENARMKGPKRTQNGIYNKNNQNNVIKNKKQNKLTCKKNKKISFSV